MTIPTLDEIRKNLKNYLTQRQRFDVTLFMFENLKSESEKVEYSLNILIKSGTFPSFSELTPKSLQLSEQYRIDGNVAFANKKDLNAIKNYTLAAGLAPPESKEFILAIANRSAVTSSLNEHSHCIKDIDFSLQRNYPTHLEYKLLERKGKSLVHLGKYREAKGVLQKALVRLSESGLSGEKFAKVESSIKDLLDQCCYYKEGEPTELSRDEPEIPELGYGKNVNIENASSAMRISFTEEMGRHLVATRDIEPGDVLAVEKPYVSILLPECYGLYCCHCLKRCHSLIPCQKCSQAYYCSEECCQQSLSIYHKVECSLLGPLLALGCSKMELLAVRTLIVAARQGTCLSDLYESVCRLEAANPLPTERGFADGRYESANYASVHFLEGNSKQRSSMDIFRRAVLAAVLLQTIDVASDFFRAEPQGHSYKLFTGGLLLNYLQIIPSNAHEVSEMLINTSTKVSESREIGGGLYPLLSLTNHSCDPNVVRHSYCGDIVVLSAIQLIKEGEQIFDNYGYHHAVHDITFRRTNLFSQYHFYCMCIACIHHWPLYDDMPSASPPQYLPGAEPEKIAQCSKEFKDILLNQIYELKGDDKLPFLYNCLTLMHKGVTRPWKVYSECQEAIKQCLSLKANHYLTSSM